MQQQFKYEIWELISASEAVVIAAELGLDVGQKTMRRYMLNFIDGIGVYRLPSVLVGEKKIPMTTRATLMEFTEKRKKAVSKSWDLRNWKI